MKWYPNTTKKVILAMCDAFSMVSYPNFVDNKDIVVPIHYTNAEKLLAFFNLTNNDRIKYNIHLPVLSLDLTSVDPTEEGQQNDSNKIQSCNQQQFIRNPTVADYTFDLSVWCRGDHEGIFWNIKEQIISKFNNTKHYPFIGLKFADGSTLNYKLPINLTGIAKNFTKFDIDKQTKMGIKSTFTFNVKGVMVLPTLAGDPTLINTINISFENEINAQWARVAIFEQTGGDVAVTIQDPI